MPSVQRQSGSLLYPSLPGEPLPASRNTKTLHAQAKAVASGLKVDSLVQRRDPKFRLLGLAQHHCLESDPARPKLLAETHPGARSRRCSHGVFGRRGARGSVPAKSEVLPARRQRPEGLQARSPASRKLTQLLLIITIINRIML